MTKTKKPKIGLALGGGGVRGFVHLGLYEVFRENNIPIACVSGTSMGAIIGGCIAMGYSPETARKTALQYKDLNLLSLKNFNFFNESLFKREQLDKIFEITFGDATFEDTKIPFRCCSVDIESEKKIVHSNGLLRKAIAASSSFPPIFPPVFHENRYLTDGGILDLVPVMALRDLKVDKLIAVRVNHNLTRQHLSALIYKKHYLGKNIEKVEPWYKKPMSFIEEKKEDMKLVLDIVVENASMASGKLADIEIEKANPDLLLTPLVNIGLLDFEKMEEAIEIGRKMAQDALPEIRKWL